MKQKLLLLIFVIMLVGCEEKLAAQAIREVEGALQEQLYERAHALLYLASHESTNPEYSALHQQSSHLVDMQRYKETNELDQLLLTWTDLNLIPSASDLIRSEAARLVAQMLEDTYEQISEREEMREIEDIISHIRLIEQRMGTFEMFESEIQELIRLRRQMEAI